MCKEWNKKKLIVVKAFDFTPTMKLQWSLMARISKTSMLCLKVANDVKLNLNRISKL